MSELRQYDPESILVSFRGLLIRGFAKGTFVEAERSNATFGLEVGSHGDATRVRNRDQSGTVKVTLIQSSPTNDQLSLMALEDEKFGTAYGALFVKDALGTTLIEEENAFIEKIASAPFADAVQQREWVFVCPSLKLFVGGGVR